jgi:hypothetical protein
LIPLAQNPPHHLHNDLHYDSDNHLCILLLKAPLSLSPPSHPTYLNPAEIMKALLNLTSHLPHHNRHDLLCPALSFHDGNHHLTIHLTSFACDH